MKILAFIPARGGSKGIVKKNLTLLCGKPLILHTLEAARKAKLVDDIFVSTDSEEIANTVTKAGLNIPYRRPPELAGDKTPMIDALLHALDWLEERECLPDNVILLQPSSPLRDPNDIDNAIRQFLDENLQSLVSVHKMREHPYECVRQNSDGSWDFLQQSETKANCRQEYHDEYYFINGAIYLCTCIFLRKYQTFMNKQTRLYVMNNQHGVDIDTPEDLLLAQHLLSSWRE